MKRYAVLAIGAFDYILNKTGNMLIRYCPDEVVAVIDPEKVGQTAEQVLGWGGVSLFFRRQHRINRHIWSSAALPRVGY